MKVNRELITVKTINLSDCYGLVLEVNEEEHDGRIVSSDLKETCPYCKEQDCNFSCDESKGMKHESIICKDVSARLEFNKMMDVVESFVLACACSGIDVDTNAFREAVDTTVQSCMNNY